MVKHSKTKLSYYRRLYVAYLIDSGINTVFSLLDATNMPRRTLQDTILALSEIDIEVAVSGGTKNRAYSISDWGAIKKSYIESNLINITDALGYKHDREFDLEERLKVLSKKIADIVFANHLSDISDIVCHFYTAGEEELSVNLSKFLTEGDALERELFFSIAAEVKNTGSVIFLKKAYDIIQLETSNCQD
ncbi:helix-turn-helix domain-containing protein [Pseudoalteromonas marina]|uniref:Helix-turn-helix domain-containing protein n=1 Tax=Pseudoalteromonas marina TaxID=267375 RepID=A0ABT9FG52_9GAMM|nr:helix-turn-helix domain-containing protein [Pseudoalteromonas marina]MDP2565765.1 helix-turn-helix domain-containing protein [Pseudoalteromonas marina]